MNLVDILEKAKRSEKSEEELRKIFNANIHQWNTHENFEEMENQIETYLKKVNVIQPEHTPLLAQPLRIARIEKRKNVKRPSNASKDNVQLKTEDNNQEHHSSLSFSEEQFKLLEKLPDVTSNLENQRYPTSFFKQFYVLSIRAFKNFLLNPYLAPAHLIVCVVVGVILGWVSKSPCQINT
jgi:hypothetical protein